MAECGGRELGPSVSLDDVRQLTACVARRSEQSDDVRNAKLFR